MALSEKQALILGVGGVAVLYLLKGKSVLAKAPGSKTATGRSPASIPSSAMRPSTNVATGGATRTTAQNPSIRTSPPWLDPKTTIGSVLGGVLGGLFGRSSQNSTFPKQAPKPPASNKPTLGGGGGAPGGNTSSGKGQTGPGNNPWSDGVFTGTSSVTGNAEPLNGRLQGYDTGLSSGEIADAVTPDVSPSGSDWLAQAREGMNADGSASDEPPAVAYDESNWQGPIADQQPLPSTPFDTYGFGDDSAAANDPGFNNDAGAFVGPIDERWIPDGGFVPDLSNPLGDASIDDVSYGDDVIE